MNTANRSFAGLAGVSTVMGILALCFGIGCVLLALLASRIVQGGWAAVTADPAGLASALGFIAIVGTGTVLGGISLRRQLRASRSLTRRVDAMELVLSPELKQAAERADLVGRVKLLDCDERLSFAYGALTPRVAISRGLVEAATPRQLDAVLTHERYHVHNLDPLKVVIIRSLPKTFPYLPALAGLHHRYLAGRELAADRRAVSEYGRDPLAGALYKVLRGPSWPELSAAAAIGGTDLLEVRLSQLEDGTEPPLTRPPLSAVLLSLVGVAVLASLLVVAVAGFGGRSAILELTGGEVTAYEAIGAALCVVPWILGTWLGLRWLAARTRLPLDSGRQSVIRFRRSTT